MAEAKPKKIVYLFGAGATHAEVANLLPRLTSNDSLQKRFGLLTSHVSARVMREARSVKGFLDDLEFLGPPNEPESVDPATEVAGAMNIELLISLIENSKVRRWEEKARTLKDLVRKDIEARLGPRKSRFYLHKALFEMQEKLHDEELIGIVSLNYDDVLDEAYKEVSRRRLNYCLSLDKDVMSSEEVPLLKLHGSFNWRRGVRMRGRKRRVDIIPLGSNKNYLHAPYNFIWTRALEVLVGCDTLRVVGCSLNQNDTHLVDLLFKAHLERTPARMKTFEIQIISDELAGKRIKQNYGFLPGIRAPGWDPSNPFLAWLKSEKERVSAEDIKRTRYLKRLK